MQSKCQAVLWYMSEGSAGLLRRDNSLFLKETGISVCCQGPRLLQESLRCLGTGALRGEELGAK